MVLPNKVTLHRWLLVMVLVVCGAPNLLLAQINNSTLNLETSPDDSAVGKVHLQLNQLHYFKNNEYFHDLHTGYTLFGSQWHTALTYQPTANLLVKGGVFFRYDFGNEKLLQLQPILVLHYEKENIGFRFGNLMGSTNHRLLDPLLNYERVILNANEYGLQAFVHRKKYWMDSWLNWEKMQYPQSPYKEELTAGHNSFLTLWANEAVKVEANVQALITHRGGQLDTDTLPLETRSNMAAGITASHKGLLKKVELQGSIHYLLYKEWNPSPNKSITQGSAWFANAAMILNKKWTFSAGYWNSNNFLAPRGGELFQSESSRYVAKPIQVKHRELIFLRAVYQHELLPNLFADIRLEPYVDIPGNFFEYSYSFYLSYRKRFVLFNEANRVNK